MDLAFTGTCVQTHYTHPRGAIVLCFIIKRKKAKKKQYLDQEGDISKGPAFVTQGILRSYSLDKNGFEHVIQFAPPGGGLGICTAS